MLVLRRSSSGHEQRAREHHQQVARARHPARAGARRRGAAAAAAAARRHVGVGGCGRREGADEAAAGGVARARPRGPRPRPRQDGQGDAPAALGTQVKRRIHVLSPHRGLVAALRSPPPVFLAIRPLAARIVPILLLLYHTSSVQYCTSKLLLPCLLAPLCCLLDRLLVASVSLVLNCKL